VEGKLIQGFEDLDIGDRIRVGLIGTDVERGFIDFPRSGRRYDPDPSVLPPQRIPFCNQFLTDFYKKCRFQLRIDKKRRAASIIPVTGGK
jgi:hypothetical protein